MTKELASFLRNAAEHCDVDVEIRDDYSGRGMYGQETHAIVTDSIPELMINTIQYIKESLESKSHAEQINFMVKIPDVSDIRRLRTDNMGRDSIVIY